MGSDKSALNSPRIVNIEDLRRVAQRRLPRVVFDCLDGGAESEDTRAVLPIRRSSNAMLMP
jgi:hypothetical protein